MSPKAICTMHAGWGLGGKAHSVTPCSRSCVKLCLPLLAYSQGLYWLFTSTRKTVCPEILPAVAILHCLGHVKNQATVFLLWGLAEA